MHPLISTQALADRLAAPGGRPLRLFDVTTHLRPATPGPWAVESGRADYLAAHRQIDMALDPFPYPGGTTSAEALWMGVPVLTLAGESALSRQGASLMHNVGLPDWVACDADHCVQLAVRHAQDLEALAALRQTLRARLLQSPVCDAPRFAAGLASCLRQVWRLHCQPGSLSLRQPPM